MANIHIGNENYEELMGGCGWNPVCYVGKAAKGTVNVVKGGVKIAAAPIKGGTHMLMEIGRGVKSGDISKILKAPLKGVGHTYMETYRGTKTIVKAAFTPLDMVTDFLDIFTGGKKKKKKITKPLDAPAYAGYTPLEEKSFPIVPVVAVAAAAVGGYFMFKG